MLRLVTAAVLLLVLLLVQWLFGDTLTRFAADLLSGLAAVPDWIVNVVIVGTRILVVVVIGGGFVVTLLRGRFRFLFTVGIAAVVAGVVAWLFDRIGPAPAADVVDVTDVLKPLNATGLPERSGRRGRGRDRDRRGAVDRPALAARGLGARDRARAHAVPERSHLVRRVAGRARSAGSSVLRCW